MTTRTVSSKQNNSGSPTFLGGGGILLSLYQKLSHLSGFAVVPVYFFASFINPTGVVDNREIVQRSLAGGRNHAPIIVIVVVVSGGLGGRIEGRRRRRHPDVSVDDVEGDAFGLRHAVGSFLQVDQSFLGSRIFGLLLFAHDDDDGRVVVLDLDAIHATRRRK